MSGTRPQQQVIDVLTRALEHDKRIEAFWLTGSFATGRADRFSNIDLRVAATLMEREFFPFIARALVDCPPWHGIKERPIGHRGRDGEYVALFEAGFILDCHVIPAAKLDINYLGEAPIKIIMDRKQRVATLHQQARETPLSATGPQQEQTAITNAVHGWACLHKGLVALKRGDTSSALGCIEAARVLLYHVLVEADERPACSFLPKYGPERVERVLREMIPPGVTAGLPVILRRTADVLAAASVALLPRDPSGRLEHYMYFVEHLIKRELKNTSTE